MRTRYSFSFLTLVVLLSSAGAARPVDKVLAVRRADLRKLVERFPPLGEAFANLMCVKATLGGMGYAGRDMIECWPSLSSIERFTHQRFALHPEHPENARCDSDSPERPDLNSRPLLVLAPHLPISIRPESSESLGFVLELLKPFVLTSTKRIPSR